MSSGKILIGEIWQETFMEYYRVTVITGILQEYYSK